MAVGGGGAAVARVRPVEVGPLRAPAQVHQTRRLAQVGSAAGAGLGRTMAGGCFRCGLVGHWKNECPRLSGVDNRSCFTCGRRGHVSRDCARRVAPADAPIRVGKGKDRAEHGPAKQRMGPNERGWLGAKNTFVDDERVQKTMEEIEKSVGPSGAQSYIGILSVAYMNVGRGCVATHVFLESYARKEVGICFVEECWVALAGNGTQSHPDYVMLGKASRGTKVVVFVRKDLVDAVLLVATMARAVVVGLGGCRVGGVYGKCGVSVNAMEDWLDTLEG